MASCQCVTKGGWRCKRQAIIGFKYCRQHQTNLEETGKCHQRRDSVPKRKQRKTEMEKLNDQALQSTAYMDFVEKAGLKNGWPGIHNVKREDEIWMRTCGKSQDEITKIIGGVKNIMRNVYSILLDNDERSADDKYQTIYDEAQKKYMVVNILQPEILGRANLSPPNKPKTNKPISDLI